LAPDDSLGVRVHVKVFLELLPGERIKLLNTGNSYVIDIIIGAVLVEGCINLTGAKYDAINLLRLDNGGAMFGVRNDPSELSIASEFFNRRTGERMTKERLRKE
jgi:hypothetical protein